MRLRSAVATALLLIATAAAPAERPLVLLVGDSTTQGTCYGCPRPPAESPARALARLRQRLPPASRWRHLRARAAGVGGSTSGDWLSIRPAVCEYAAARGRADAYLGARVLRRACERRSGLAAATLELVGEPPALVLLVLGANDVMDHVAPEDYVANVRAIAQAFAPAPVLVATPFWSSQPERAGLAELAAALRRANLVAGPDFYAVHLPLDSSGVHLTPGGYAAAGALWLDVLRR